MVSITKNVRERASSRFLVQKKPEGYAGCPKKKGENRGELTASARAESRQPKRTEEGLYGRKRGGKQLRGSNIRVKKPNSLLITGTRNRSRAKKKKKQQEKLESPLKRRLGELCCTRKI